jgi:hypothetical protein
MRKGIVSNKRKFFMPLNPNVGDAEKIRTLMECDVVTIDEMRGLVGLGPLPDGKGAYTLTDYRVRQG